MRRWRQEELGMGGWMRDGVGWGGEGAMWREGMGKWREGGQSDVCWMVGWGMSCQPWPCKPLHGR